MKLKQFARWGILAGTGVFLLQAVAARWEEVAAIELGRTQLGWGLLAFTLTGLAHAWSGLVWGWILEFFGCSVRRGWLLRVYLQTNLAKYVPGNVWHLYGRLEAVRELGNPLGTATLSVLLEPLLMAAAAALLASVTARVNPEYAALQVAAPAVILVGIHPRILTWLLGYLNRSLPAAPPLQRYPWGPLLGELAFVTLRGLGFVAAIAGFLPLGPADLPAMLGAFSCAWFLGLIVPTPGGLGVFEVTALALLENLGAAGTLLAALALFRLSSVSAEAATAALAWGSIRLKQ